VLGGRYRINANVTNVLAVEYLRADRDKHAGYDMEMRKACRGEPVPTRMVDGQ
jgi:hypothetical protein